MIYATHIAYTSLDKEPALGLPQLGLRSVADSNIWNKNRKPQNFETDAQSTAPGGF